MLTAKPLWEPCPSQINTSHMRQFQNFIERRHNLYFQTYTQLHNWSLENLDLFWADVWNYVDIIGTKEPPFLDTPEDIMEAVFFPACTLNYAQNLLRNSSQKEAIVFWSEKGTKRRLTYADLHDQVGRVIQYYQSLNLTKGDCIAAMVANTPETLIAMLAASALGLIWSSCSPDFGVQGILDRFQQIKPRLFIGTDEYYYGGKHFPCLDKIQQVVAQLSTVEAIFILPYDPKTPVSINHLPPLSKPKRYEDLLALFPEPQPIFFESLPFNHPLFITFSSGTTGVPKCIVHGAGNVLLQHMKEHQLHCDIKPGDRVFYFSTCGWMMWNWHVSALASGATLLLFEGSPVFPTPHILFDLASEEKMTLFGTGSKFIDTLRKRNITPLPKHDLSKLRVLTSTGGPLVAESFDYIYQHIKADLLVASISGGTDILSCFVLGNPTHPVWRGEIQGPGLGMAVEVFDENGASVAQQKGELVCTKPFPSRPLGFWEDHAQEKYKEAYFSKYPNTWNHGDFAEITENKGFIIYGRSDAILNPGGIRIGTAEIYRQAEQHPSVVESLAISQQWDDDVRIVLFVVLHQDVRLTEALQKELKSLIRTNTSPRHVPAKIIAVPELPKTRSGKLVELAVQKVVHGEDVLNINSLENPACLAYFMDIAELQLP